MIETYSKSDFRHSCNLKFYCHGVMFTGGQTFHLFDNNNVWFINNLSLLSSKCMLTDLLLIWWWLCHETQMPKKVELHNCSNYLLQKISSNNSIFSDIFMIFYFNDKTSYKINLNSNSIWFKCQSLFLFHKISLQYLLCI